MKEGERNDGERERKNYYEILGIPSTATSHEIKKAYRALALQYHPDKNPGSQDAEMAFKEATAAYEILSDDQKRKDYDLSIHSTRNSFNHHAADHNKPKQQFPEWFTDFLKKKF